MVFKAGGQGYGGIRPVSNNMPPLVFVLYMNNPTIIVRSIKKCSPKSPALMRRFLDPGVLWCFIANTPDLANQDFCKDWKIIACCVQLDVTD